MPATATPVQTDSETLVNRIIAELRADPAAQDMLLKALLTGEFLGIPVRLEGIEETLRSIQASIGAIETRLDRLETTVDRLETTVRRLDDTVGDLSGKSYEASLATRLDSILSQRLGFRRPQTIRSMVDRMPPEISAQLEDAFEENLISDSQRERIIQTDFIIRAQRKSDRAWIWLAVEASVSIHRDDIDRALQSAHALTAVFAEPAVPVAVGQRIDAPETQYAQSAAVHTTIVT